jgi:hypothetical protein
MHWHFILNKAKKKIFQNLKHFASKKNLISQYYLPAHQRAISLLPYSPLIRINTARSIKQPRRTLTIPITGSENLILCIKTLP